MFKKSICFIVSLGTFSSVGFAASDLTKCQTLFKKRYETENNFATVCKKEAEQGHVEAQYILAKIYDSGKGGFKEDKKKAIYWYKKAAEHGSAKMQYELAEMYSYGEEGVFLADSEKAHYWFKKAFENYKKAADKGDAESQAWVGEMYRIGAGVEESDRDQALTWFRKAAKQGHEGARERLFLWWGFLSGKNLIENEQVAYMWYWLAVKKNKKIYANELKEIAKKLTPKQIEEAKKMAKECEDSAYQKCGYTDGSEDFESDDAQG